MPLGHLLNYLTSKETLSLIEAKFAHQFFGVSCFLLSFLFFLDAYDLGFSLSLESLALKIAQLLTAEVGVDLGATDAARNVFSCSFPCVFRALPNPFVLPLSFLIPFWPMLPVLLLLLLLLLLVMLPSLGFFPAVFPFKPMSTSLFLLSPVLNPWSGGGDDHDDQGDGDGERRLRATGGVEETLWVSLAFFVLQQRHPSAAGCLTMGPTMSDGCDVQRRPAARSLSARGRTTSRNVRDTRSPWELASSTPRRDKRKINK